MLIRFIFISAGLHLFLVLGLLFISRVQSRDEQNDSFTSSSLRFELYEKLSAPPSPEMAPQSTQKQQTKMQPRGEIKNTHTDQSFVDSSESSSSSSVSGQEEMQTHAQASQNYLAVVRSKIESQKHYPQASKLMRESGTVHILIDLAHTGHVKKLEVQRSSGFRRLDESALKAVAKAAPFDPIPEVFNLSDWKITVPIRFE